MYYVIAANCVYALHSLLAQHQTRERVSPEDILSHIKKHRLFPQTEASIRLRFRDIKICLNLGLEVWLPQWHKAHGEQNRRYSHHLHSAGSQPFRRYGCYTDSQRERCRCAGLGVSAQGLHVRGCHYRVSQSRGHVAVCHDENQYPD